MNEYRLPMNEYYLPGYDQEEPDVFSANNIVEAAKRLNAVPQYTIQQQKKSPMSDELYKQLTERQLESFKQQGAGLKAFEAGMQGPQETDPVLAITSGLSDMFAGTNRLAGLTNQKSMQEQQAKQDQFRLQDMKKDLTKAEIDMLKNQFQHQQDSEKLGMTMKLAREKMATESGQKLSPYQETKQKKLGATQAAYLTGDRAVLSSNLDKVNSAVARLESGDVSTGTWGKQLAPGVSGFFDSDFAATKADIESAITDTLRPTLGAAFTHKEGEQIKALTFDPGQPPEENARRARRLATYIQKKIEFQDAFGEYLDKNNGNDAGFPFHKYGMRKEGSSSVTPAEGEVKQWNGKTYKKQGDLWVEAK